VRPDGHAECRNGLCVIPPDSCEPGFAHCSAFPTDGCEADLRASNTCGDCDTQCFGSTPACTRGPNGLHCSSGCSEETPDLCNGICTDLDTDVGNCGACWNDCANHVLAECVNGECRSLGPCESHYGDCTDEPGCETMLTSAEHCGACGRDDCGAANAVVECSSASGCVPPTCTSGFANCDRTSVDCEANGTACFPDELAPIELTSPPTRIAIIDGGAFFVFGSFGDSLDFDPSTARDVHSAAGEIDAYVTRYEANGAYSWTRTFGGSLVDYPTAARVARDGTLLIGGTFFGTADFDPGSGVDPHVADTSGSGFVSKLTAAGVLVWARDFLGQANVEQLAGDAAGAVYAIGTFAGTIDLDPGPATSLHTADRETSAFLVKLDASGTFVWARVTSGDGERVISGLAVAADASVWISGWQEGRVSFGDRSLGEEQGMFVAGLEPSGAVRTLWLPGAAAISDRPTVGAGASVYVEGSLMESLDLDPGAGTDVRLSFYPGGGSGFAVGLGLDGTYRNAHVFEREPEAIDETPGGGYLVQLPDSFPPDSRPNLMAYYSDGTPQWTLRAGSGTYSALTVSATHFAVWGVEERRSQGPLGADERSFTSGDRIFVRRYAF
jgi:hypothetical protein